MIPRTREALLPEIVIITVNTFNEESATKFRDAVAKAQSTGQTILPIVIDSYGGAVYSLLSMIDALTESKIPIATIAIGKAMSCGAILLSCGKNGMRYASPNSTILVHQVSSIAYGKNSDIKIKVEETDRLNEKILRIMSKNIGKKEGFFAKMVKDHNYGDVYITPEDALACNLVNHIGIPTITTEIKVVTTVS